MLNSIGAKEAKEYLSRKQWAMIQYNINLEICSLFPRKEKSPSYDGLNTYMVLAISIAKSI